MPSEIQTVSLKTVLSILLATHYFSATMLSKIIQFNSLFSIIGVVNDDNVQWTKCLNLIDFSHNVDYPVAIAL